MYVDIDPLSFNIDSSRVRDAITARTKAIIPVHLFGQMAEMAPLLEVAESVGIAIVEDAAQAIGAEWRGRRAGSIGVLGCFSFFPSKNLGGYGDGGMVTTNDAALAEKARLLRNHGHRPKYHSRLLGGNFRLDAIQAAVLRVKLPHLDGWIEARCANARHYHRLMRQAALGVRIRLPEELPERRHTYNQFVVRCEGRDALATHLRARGIGCEVYYPVPLHLQECFASMGGSSGDFPEAERAAEETLAIPIHPDLTEQMIATVASAVADFYC